MPVKRRLQPPLARSQAAWLAAALLDQTLHRVLGPAGGSTAWPPICSLSLWLAPDTESAWAQRHRARFAVTARRQPSGDLGRRMAEILQAESATGPALVIGGDCAGLSRAHIIAACRGLREGLDAVVVPAEDGGYTLLGIAEAPPTLYAELFADIPWGGPEVYAHTQRRLDGLGWAWRALPAAWDVDRPADLARLAVVCDPPLADAGFLRFDQGPSALHGEPRTDLSRQPSVP